jgi:hypothetical protein
MLNGRCQLLQLVESTMGSQVCTDLFASRQSVRSGSKICHSSSLSSQCNLTLSSSIGHNRPSRSDSTRHGIYCLKLYKHFESQGQKVFSSTLLVVTVMVSVSATAFVHQILTAVTASLRQTASSRHCRSFRQSTGAPACSEWPSTV